MTIHESLNEALSLWLELIGINPAAQSFSLGDWGLRTVCEKLNQAQELDDTGLSTALLLEHAFLKFVKQAKCSLRELLDEDAGVIQQINTAERLEKLLAGPAIREPVLEFQARLTEALMFYKVPPDVIEYAGDPIQLGLLRRDALLSARSLEVHQFLPGSPTTQTAARNEWVLQFFNTSSLVDGLLKQTKPGMTLCLVRDSMAEFSYFVIAIWNGGAVYLLTDRDQHPHPDFKNQSRRPDKQLASRWDRHHFPYELLDAEFVDRAVRIPKQQGLVLYDAQAIRLKQFNELPADCVIWLYLLFDLLQEKYFRHTINLPEMSYTVETVQTAVKSPSALIKRPEWVKFKLPKLTRASIATDKLIKSQGWGKAVSRHHQWMLDRYAPKVPDSVLNLVKNEQQKLLLPPKAQPGSETFLKKLEKFATYNHHHRDEAVDLKVLEPDAFATQKQLLADQQWCARYNQCKAVQMLAQEEYNEEAGNMLNWFSSRMKLRQAELVKLAVLDELAVTYRDPRNFTGFDSCDRSMYAEVTGNILQRTYVVNDGPPGGLGSYIHTSSYRGSLVVVLAGDVKEKKQGWSRRAENRRRRCLINYQYAQVFVWFADHNPQQLAAVCGCKEEELPELLRHRYSNEPYTGNSILDRIDPAEWVLEDPWQKFELKVMLCFSLKGYNDERKARGLPPCTLRDIDPQKFDMHEAELARKRERKARYRGGV